MNNFNFISGKELLRSDLRRTIIHESAHLVLLKKFGGNGFIEIIRTYTENLFENSFTGSVYIVNITTDSIHRSMIGAAGYISGFILNDINQDSGLNEDDAFNFFEFDYNELSDTDKELMGDITYEVFCDTYDFVKKYWSEIEAEAKIHFDMHSKMYEL
tara:strand:+ start:5947 stop:6420 length:474 start_codon:yes stop_codon:yes gene_type:complete